MCHYWLEFANISNLDVPLGNDVPFLYQKRYLKYPDRYLRGFW